MNNFDINAFLAATSKLDNAATTALDEVRIRNERIAFLNTELDNINKVLIPNKENNIAQVVSVLSHIDNQLTELRSKNVKGDLINNLVTHRKQGISGMMDLKRDLESLRYKASSYAREKAELTKLARGIVEKKEAATRTVLSEGTSLGTLKLVVNQ